MYGWVFRGYTSFVADVSMGHCAIQLYQSCCMSDGVGVSVPLYFFSFKVGTKLVIE